MSFSADLLDGFDLLNKRTEGVLKTASTTSEFFHKLSKVEKEYAKSLQQLVSSHKVALQKAPPPQKELSSSASSWETILTELEKLAEHHRTYGDAIDNDCSVPVANWTKEKKKVRTKLEADSTRITKDMKAQLENLQKTRSKYVSLSREADKDEATHTKGKGDVNMKPSQLAKLAQKASQAQDRASVADNEYQSVLNTTNQKQSEFYISTMPSLLGEFQQFEEDRIQYMKSILEKYADIASEKPAQYTSATDSITSAARAIQVDTDISAFVSENRTLVSVPSDIPYIPYDSEVPSQPKQKPVKASTGGPSPITTNSTTTSTIGAPPVKNKYPYKQAHDNDILTSREWGLSNSDHSLSADEQANKLQAQLDDLDKALNSETKSKEGLENLVRFYASDPVAQKKAEDEIQDIEQKLVKLHETRNYVQGQLDNIGGSSNGGARSNSKPVTARGLYDYNATCDTELSFKEGDMLRVTEQDESGWWYAELNGRAGFVPHNYLQVQ